MPDISSSTFLNQVQVPQTSTTGAAASAPAVASAAKGLGKDDFLKLLMAQLANQDPTAPTDNQQFVAQLAQFSALEINRQQSEKVDQLLNMQAADQAVGLIGRQVEVRNALGGSSVGTVAAISFRSGEPLLTLTSNGSTLVDVSLADIVLIRQ